MGSSDDSYQDQMMEDEDARTKELEAQEKAKNLKTQQNQLDQLNRMRGGSTGASGGSGGSPSQGGYKQTLGG